MNRANRANWVLDMPTTVLVQVTAVHWALVPDGNHHCEFTVLHCARFSTRVRHAYKCSLAELVRYAHMCSVSVHVRSANYCSLCGYHLYVWYIPNGRLV